MIHLEFDNIEDLKNTHYSAVKDYMMAQSDATQNDVYLAVKNFFEGLPDARPNNYDWLKGFILADAEVLESWVNSKPAQLKFKFFKELYLSKFAKIDKYVDRACTYNAYTLFSMMDIKVCPYCDDEYFDILHPIQGKRRTCDFDHFYPKGDEYYPGLAMCFFNLIPSGKDCNFIMNTASVSANPYHPDIEKWSHFESNIPIGTNIEKLPMDAFSVSFRVSGKMISNNSTLALEERYNHRKEIIRDILLANQDFNADACKEYIAMGLTSDWIQRRKEVALGLPYPKDRGKKLHQKLKFDLTGY